MKLGIRSIASWATVKITPAYFKYRRWKNKRFFLHNASAHPYKVPQKGLTIVASLGGNVSLNKVMRDLAFSLREAGIPFQTFSLSPRNKVPPQDVLPILTPIKDFHARRFSHVIEMYDSHFPAEELGLKRMTVAFWEFESGLTDHLPGLITKQAIIGMSDFNVNYFRTTFPTMPITKVLYPFRLCSTDLTPNDSMRKRYGIAKDDFVVFFNFDFSSGYHRKNPYGVLKAFAQAFHDKPNTKLVFKTIHAEDHPDKVAELHTLSCQLGIDTRCISINEFISQKDLYGLTNACDVYISLHRGEGFGLGIAEAMSLGKPVITTDYSAPTEFCNPTNSIPISYQLIKPEPSQQDVPYYKNVTTWADPKISEAAKALRSLYDDPKLRDRIGQAAKAFIADYFSIDNFRRSAFKLLDS